MSDEIENAVILDDDLPAGFDPDEMDASATEVERDE